MNEPERASFDEVADIILGRVGLSYNPGKLIPDELSIAQVETVRAGFKELICDMEDGRVVVAGTGPSLLPVYAFVGEYEKALELLQPDYPDEYLNVRLTLKHHLEKDIEAAELMRLFARSFTQWGRSSILGVSLVKHMNGLIASWKAECDDKLLSSIANACYYDFERNPGEGARHFHAMRPIKGVTGIGFGMVVIHFSHHLFSSFRIEELAREFENAERESRNLPKIGEGWIAETELYYKVKEEFPDMEVIHHGSPSWLGSQHLDIYMPDIQVGIEYQGIQHRRPVDYFGGDEAFKTQTQRDRRKRTLCEKNGLLLVEVDQDYAFSDLVVTIRQRRRLLNAPPS